MLHDFLILFLNCIFLNLGVFPQSLKQKTEDPYPSVSVSDSNHRSRSARLSAVFLQTRGHRRTARMRGKKRALYRERSGESLHITQYGSRGNLDFLQYRSVVLKQRRSSLLEKMQMKGLTPAWAKLIHTAAVRYPPGTTGPRANTLQ